MKSDYPCPVCGFLTMDEDMYGSYNICSVCGWEDDGVQLANPTSRGGANYNSFAEAQAKALSKYPQEIAELDDVLRCKLWRPLSKQEIELAKSQTKSRRWSNKGIVDRLSVYWLKNS